MWLPRMTAFAPLPRISGHRFRARGGPESAAAPPDRAIALCLGPGQHAPSFDSAGYSTICGYLDRNADRHLHRAGQIYLRISASSLLESRDFAFCTGGCAGRTLPIARGAGTHHTGALDDAAEPFLRRS